MLLVAGLSLSNLQPRVWDTNSPYYIPELQAIMVSYADFCKMPSKKRDAMKNGLRKTLGIPNGIEVYLDNGSFYFLKQQGDEKSEYSDYDEFVDKVRPDWWPIPRDFIPLPKMKYQEQMACFRRTMSINKDYRKASYVPVIHIGRFLKDYLVEICNCKYISDKPDIALGGIVPNLLRARKALPYNKVLKSLINVRRKFHDKKLHVFGIGGIATLHLAYLLEIDSTDSNGWRNRAARGIIQLPGSGDRVVAELGNWRGRRPSKEEWDMIDQCKCPACKLYGLDGLKAGGLQGFCNRATHNLWTLLKESELISKHFDEGTYFDWLPHHINNSTYKPLIEYLAENVKRSNSSSIKLK